MYRTVYVFNKSIIMKPYTTQDELELLEFLAFNKYDNDDEYETIVDEFLSRCVKDYNRFMTKIEKIILLWNLRIISQGDEIRIVYKCPKCNNKITLRLQINDIIMNASIKSKNVKHKILSIHEFKGKDELTNIDNLDISEYDDIIDHITDYFTLYDDAIEHKCPMCGNMSKINPISYKNALSFMSDDSFASLTSYIHALVYSGNNTRQDVLSMTPVQRLMEIKYFESHDENKQRTIENG